MMRTTAGHNAVLINGLPHQYHDGTEGTNASDAAAKLLGHGEQDGVLFAHSDASPAYQLVDPNIEKVVRSLFFVPDMHSTIVLDTVRMKSGQTATLQARYFAYNMDGQGSIELIPNGFKTTRPNAHISGRFFGNQAVMVNTAQLPIAPERQADYPFAHADLPAAEMNWLVTVLNAGSDNTKSAAGRVQQVDDNFGTAIVVTLERDEKSIMVIMRPEGDDPTFFTVQRS